MVFNDAGCKAWTTSWPFECFQRIHQRVCYYLSPSFPWLSRTYFILSNKRMGERRVLLCFCPLTCCALEQIGCGTLPVAPVLTSASTGPLAECASAGYDGTAGTSISAIAQLEWDCLSNCSRARRDLIYFLLYSSERERGQIYPLASFLPQSMNYLWISQWVDRSKDTDKFLEPRKWSVFSASSPSCTYCDILISFPHVWQTSCVMQRNHDLLPIFTNFGSFKKTQQTPRNPNPVPSPFLPKQFNYLPDSTKNPLEKNIFCIYCGYLLVILSVSQFKLKAQLFFLPLQGDFKQHWNLFRWGQSSHLHFNFTRVREICG